MCTPSYYLNNNPNSLSYRYNTYDNSVPVPIQDIYQYESGQYPVGLYQPTLRRRYPASVPILPWSGEELKPCTRIESPNTSFCPPSIQQIRGICGGVGEGNVSRNIPMPY